MHQAQFSPKQKLAELTGQRLEREVNRSRLAYDQLKAEKRNCKARNHRLRRRLNQHIRAAKQNHQQAQRELKRYKTRQLLSG